MRDNAARPVYVFSLNYQGPEDTRRARECCILDVIIGSGKYKPVEGCYKGAHELFVRRPCRCIPRVQRTAHTGAKGSEAGVYSVPR